MRRVLALVDDSPVAAAVAATASTVATANSLELDLVSVVAPGDAVHGTDRHERTIPALRPDTPPWRPRIVPGPLRTEVLDGLIDESVALVVLGARSSDGKPDGLGHIARAIATTSALPLVLVPPRAAPLLDDDLRFLLPLDGEPTTTTAVTCVIEDFVAPMGSVIPLHVYSASTIPMLISSDEDRAVLADEFAARHLGRATERSVRPQFGLGDPADEIIAALERERIDAVVLGWSQRFDRGRAGVVRRILTDGRVVVVLGPVARP